MAEFSDDVKRYRDKHELQQLFQVRPTCLEPTNMTFWCLKEMMTALLKEQPDDPLRFLYRAIRQKVAIKEGKVYSNNQTIPFQSR